MYILCYHSEIRNRMQVQYLMSLMTWAYNKVYFSIRVMILKPSLDFKVRFTITGIQTYTKINAYYFSFIDKPICFSYRTGQFLDHCHVRRCSITHNSTNFKTIFVKFKNNIHQCWQKELVIKTTIASIMWSNYVNLSSITRKN